MKKRKQYSEPQIYFGCPKGGKPRIKDERGNPIEWFIYYSYRNPVTGKMERRKVKGGINEYHTITERTTEAKLLRQDVSDMLAHDYDPFDKMKVEQPEHSFKTAIEWALKTKHEDEAEISTFTYQVYTTSVKHILWAAEQCGITSMPITEVRRAHLKDIMVKMTKKYNLQPAYYNLHLLHLKALFSKMIDWEILDSSVAAPLQRKAVPDQEKYESLSTGQKTKLLEILKDYPRFLTFLLCVHSGIRPKEVFGLKGVDDMGTHFRLPRHIRKGKKLKPRLSAINPFLRQMLDQHCAGMNKNDFLFTKGFVPGAEPVWHKYHNRWWNKHVAPVIGHLPYDMKYTGADDLIRVVKDPKTLQWQLGHASDTMSKRYAQEADRIMADDLSKIAPSFTDNLQSPAV